jgi:hypothetical protein
MLLTSLAASTDVLSSVIAFNQCREVLSAKNEIVSRANAQKRAQIRIIEWQCKSVSRVKS